MRTAPVIVFPRPLDIVPILDEDDVLLLPALWPVRLNPQQRRELAYALLDLDEH
ncbi:hypothetical protein ACFYY8_33665 [Streptosporangium sp. NPDC001559]|uniref:hypothetical protein n=1 Tax=Streptosporangium sp. NPDC001559 TaxID=3366187 RepID=UPI0036E8C0EE